jgi:hypothetical protein
MPDNKQEQTDAMERVEKATWDEVVKVYPDALYSSHVLTAFQITWKAAYAAGQANGIKLSGRDVSAGYAAALEAGKAVDENGLKPCPFCGGEADLLKAKPDDAWPEDYVTCKNHDCDIFGNYSATVESWNRRAR